MFLHVAQDLFRRRLPHFLAVFLAAIWGVVESVDWLVDRYALSPHLVDLALVALLCMIPTVLMIAYFHGGSGAQRWTRVEKVGIPANLLAAAAVLVVMFSGKDLSARAATSEPSGYGLDPNRVAVLYFDDLSKDQDLGYLGDGLTEALIANLTRVRQLDVISRNGVAPYRSTEVSPDSIARALRAGSIIDGSVDRAREELRVSLRFIDGSSGADYARTSFVLPVYEFIAARDSVGDGASRILGRWLGREIRLRELQGETANSAAWVWFQRGERARKDARARRRVRDHQAFIYLARADSFFAHAAGLDTTWIEPIVARGEVTYRRSLWTDDKEQVVESIDDGLRYAELALELDPDYAAALELRGTGRYLSWIRGRPHEPEEAASLLNSALEDLEAATQADPSRASAQRTLSELYYALGDGSAGVQAARRAYELDTYLDGAEQVLWLLSVRSLDLAHFVQAERWCQEGARRFPDDYRFTACRLRLMMTPATALDVDEAWLLLASLDTLTPDYVREYWSAQGLMLVGAAIARAGSPDSARAVLQRARRMVPHRVDPSQELLLVEAYVNILIGNKDRAVDLLKRFRAANPGRFEGGPGDWYAFTQTDTSWWWRELNDHSGFQELTRGRP